MSKVPKELDNWYKYDYPKYKNWVIAYFSVHGDGIVYPSDVADLFDLDYILVESIISELEDEGIVQEVKTKQGGQMVKSLGSYPKN